jgi:glycosyltransferase involved in cell wall biosynthesis
LFKIFGSLLIKFDKFLVKNYIKYSVVADDFNYKRFEKIYDIKPEIINYGIDYEFFSNGNGEKVKKIYNLKNKFVLLQTGTLTPLKNQMESIKVVEKLKDKIPNIKLVLVGWGEENYEKMLKDYVKEHKLEDNVIFTGHLKREVIRNLNDACDVALFPMKSQGGWLSPFEVLCAGKPIIVSSFTTSSDIIKKNVLGIVTDDFSKAVLDVYKNKAKYKKISERGKKWVEENLTWDNFSGKMLEVFDKVIE